MIFLKDGKFFCDVQLRVRYAETDKMGYVYYGNYLIYYEVARTEFLRLFGFSYKQFEDDGYLLPVAKASLNYLKPAKYDDLLKVRIYHKYFHEIKIEYDYEVYNQDNQLINTGNTLLIFVDEKTRRPKQGPKYYTQKLKETFDKISKNE